MSNCHSILRGLSLTVSIKPATRSSLVRTHVGRLLVRVVVDRVIVSGEIKDRNEVEERKM